MKNKKGMRRFLPRNKKAAEMTIGTIIIIILALVVLVVLVYGFSTGWTNLWDKIVGFGGGKANVQTIVQSCQLACTTSSQYDYCKTRKLIEGPDEDGKMVTRNVNCKELEGATYGLSVCDITCPDDEKEAKCKAITDVAVDGACVSDADCKLSDATPPTCILK